MLENQRALSEFIEIKSIEAVINKELTLTVFANKGDSKLVYLLFNSSDKPAEIVYPFQFEE